MEKRYDVRVINLLLDKYERSAVYQGTAKRNQSVSLSVNKRLFPEYFDLTSMEFEVINEQMENLAALNLITLLWRGKKTDGILQKIVLCLEPESLAAAYRFVARKTRREKEEAVRSVLATYRDIFPSFVSWAQGRLDSHESVRKYIDIDHPDKLSDVLYLAEKIRENKEDIFLRRFSIRVFHDSKIAEHEIGSAVDILKKFPDDEQEAGLEGLSADEVLEEYNIYRNPSWVMVKGCGAPLALPMGVGISNEDIDRIPWDVSCVPRRILTIENLTSFHQWRTGPVSRDLVIYLGGYANRARRQMLVRLHEMYPDAFYAHFGDIDVGGFRIWKNLCRSTGLAIETLLMDEETYLHYIQYGKPLTDHDRRSLIEMMEDPFFHKQRELFALMLEKGIKVEQECVILCQ